ncbi:MAG TPA: LuxR C-terminal-related transcriptional regulator, partial [Solirubrobacteraceae bacterium]|nr:LuxR C-terminal-related transcriptional regulator [Solirubrobacteraceae bacterium]
PPNLPTAIAERLYRDSGGNPFYLEELVRWFQGGGESPAAPTGGEGDPVPPAVTAVIADEFGRLSAGARELAQAAAVVGDPFEPEIAGEIVDMDEEQALTALDELVDRDLVQVAAPTGRFSFRHAIVRRAVYESAKGGWRRSAHARAAAVLSERGAPAAARARHVERSASFGDLDAIAVLTDAGYSSAARAPATAASWFRAALRLLPERHPPEERLNLTLATAVSLGSAGDLEASRDAFQEVLELQPATALRSSAVAAAALVEHLLGNHDQAQGLLLGALPGLDDEAPEAAELKLEIADGCFFSADWEGMRYWAQRALDAGEATPMLRAGVGAALALADYGLGDTKAAEDSVARATAIADRLSDGEWASRLQSICLLGWSEYCVGRCDAAERHMMRALAVSRTTGQEHLSAAMLVVGAMSNLALGRLTAASEQAETAIDTSLLSANQLFLTWALTVRCMVEIEGGTPSSAARFGRKAVEAGLQSRSAWSSVATLYLAEAWLEAGEPERFRRELFAGESTPRLPPFPFYAVHAYELLSRAELELGLPAAAARWAEQGTELADRIGLPGPRAEAQRAQARLLRGEGAFTAAADTARLSAEEAERAGQPLQAARSRLLQGAALHQAGDAEEAVRELRRAEGMFAAHRAWRYRDQAARELRRLGVHAVAPRGPAPVGAGLDALSRRELTIARLVHEGHTNREIADELSISIKTVENHLTRIFRALEISSRSQLATLVERSRGVAA